MHTYFCQKCPVAFKIGHSLNWNLIGSVDMLVCQSCGTTHQLNFKKASPQSHDYQTGSSQLFALPGRARKPEELQGREDWIKVGVFQNYPPLESLTCNHCKIQGGLIGLEKPVSKDGYWPVFRDKEGSHCPLCGEAIEVVCVSV